MPTGTSPWAAAAQQAAAAAARVTPPRPPGATATWKPPPQCDVHRDVKWLVPLSFREAELNPPCFVCDPGWWAEHSPLPMVSYASPSEPEAVADLVQEYLVDPGRWPPQ